MKLIYKITFFYLLITLVVFFIGYVVTNQVIKREVNYEEQRFLNERLESVLRMIERRPPGKAFEREKIRITPLAGTHEVSSLQFSDTLVMHQSLQRIEPHLKLDVIREVDGKFYLISLYDLIVEEDDIEEGVRESLIIMYLILALVFVLLAVIFSYKMLAPFNRTLLSIKNFNLKKDNSIVFKKSGTKEFNKLNMFLNEMTEKMRGDYKALKEFTENASHEMQTPLAIATGKLELLVDTDLNDEQTMLLNSAQDSIRRLSRMGNALSLLTKIDNREFHQIEKVNFSELVEKLLFDFKELIELKEITVTKEIKNKVFIRMDPTLAAIMVTNLLQNGIRHNHVGGNIHVDLKASGFVISNSGPPLTFDPSMMFQRFKKNDQSKESIGLGLAIVKKICDVSGFNIRYKFKDPNHKISIDF